MNKATKIAIGLIAALAIIGPAACSKKEGPGELSYDEIIHTDPARMQYLSVEKEDDSDRKGKKSKSNPSYEAQNYPLHFPGETVLAHLTLPTRRWEVVTSCAPEKSGCSPTKLKVRALTNRIFGKQKWQFADIESCPGGLDAWEAYDKALFKTESKQKKFASVISPCLQTSYTDSPYRRGPRTPLIPVE